MDLNEQRMEVERMLFRLLTEANITKAGNNMQLSITCSKSLIASFYKLIGCASCLKGSLYQYLPDGIETKEVLYSN